MMRILVFYALAVGPLLTSFEPLQAASPYHHCWWHHHHHHCHV
jgi:hypothetical protein